MSDRQLIGWSLLTGSTYHVTKPHAVAFTLAQTEVAARWMLVNKLKSGAILHNHVAPPPLFPPILPLPYFSSDLRELQPPTENPKTSRKYNRPSLQQTDSAKGMHKIQLWKCCIFSIQKLKEVQFKFIIT